MKKIEFAVSKEIRVHDEPASLKTVLKNCAILFISSYYHRIIGQYFYFASTQQDFFCPFKNSKFSHDIDGVAAGIESTF